MLPAILEFLKSAASIITWPMAVLIIALIFRKQLFLAVKAITERIETAEKLGIGKDGLILEGLVKKVEEAEKKADEAQKDVQALVLTGTQQKEPFEESKRRMQEKAVAKKRTEGIEQDNVEDSDISEQNPDDPQRGKWGNSPKSNNRELRAKVTPLSGSTPLYRIEMEVVSTNSFNPLKGKVRFHLHDTFPNQNPEVEVVEGKASLSLLSYGSFTVVLKQMKGKPNWN